MMMMFISQLDLKSSNANIVCAPLQKICPFCWFLVQLKWKCSRHRDSWLVGPAPSWAFENGFYSMAIQTSSLTVMVKRKLERICSPSVSSAKRSTCPHLPWEDYSPSSVFHNPSLPVDRFSAIISMFRSRCSLNHQSATVETYHSPRSSSSGYIWFPGNKILWHLFHANISIMPYWICGRYALHSHRPTRIT